MGMLDRSSPFGPLRTVQVSRSNILRRRAAGWTGIQVETVDVIHSAPFEYRAVSPAHMLILTERGSRSDGETMIEGAAKSTLRDFSPRLSLVPVGYRYCGWQKPHVLTRVTYLHIDPAGPLLDPGAAIFRDRVHAQAVFPGPRPMGDRTQAQEPNRETGIA